MEHQHVSKGSPYDHSAPVTCLACKVMLREALIRNFKKSCEKYGTPFDLRIIADMLDKYKEVENAEVSIFL